MQAQEARAEVLRQLAGEGYVELHENRGAQVAPMSHKTLRNFFTVAPMIYAAVARLATQHATPAQVEQLKEVQRAFRAAIRADRAADAGTWECGYRGLFLCEYHLATRDDAVLPAIRGLTLALARGQGMFGTYGHGFADDLRGAARRERGATVFGYQVKDPERYGVVEFDREGRAIGLDQQIDLVDMQAMGVVGFDSEGARKVLAHLHDEQPIGIGAGAMQLLDGGAGVHRQAHPAIDGGRSRCGHDTWVEVIEHGSEPAEVGRHEVDRRARVEIGRAHV